jgi:hypothetical protein
MRTTIRVYACAAVVVLACSTLAAQEKQPGQSYESTITQRIGEGIAHIQADPWPSPAKSPNHAVPIALLSLFKNENVAEANRFVVEYCGRDVQLRCEALFRIYLLEHTRNRLTDEARKAIENYAWELLTKHARGITTADADKPFWDFNSSENHYLNDRRRYTLALWIVRMSKNYGPKAEFAGKTIDEHCQAWETFWINYFLDRSNQGVDLELAHPSSYGICTNGVYYDLYDLTDNRRLRELAGNYITLFWAEVASEYDPSIGQRAGLATTRTPNYWGYNYWARDLLYCYGWSENGFEIRFLGYSLFLTSSYRPPEILKAIASDPKRGNYLVTSRRPGMEKRVETPWPHEPGKKPRKGLQIHRTIVFDKDGNSHIRRNVYYARDYALGTVIFSPEYDFYNPIVLAQSMGATFASDRSNIINIIGRGHYARRATVGITGEGVSIISRDAKAEPGRDRFKSDGTSIFISNGSLWDNRIEDESEWFFTHDDGNAYVAVRPADKGYQATTRAFIWPDRKLKEVEEKHGHHLELNDMWAPVVIQMGRKADYKSFEDFCNSVKSRPFVYENGKLSYTSEAGDQYEYWSKLTQLPKINGKTLDLNPAKTYDTPYLSMVHGESQAVISYPGYKDLTLNFNRSEKE